MLGNDENVARALFAPKMIYNGELQTEAFKLRETISEKYISVVRTTMPSWKADIMNIPQGKNRKLYGYALMNVGDIRKASFNNVVYEVKECDNSFLKSHAGIFITVAGESLIGGRRMNTITDQASQDFILLLIQRRLVEIARKGLHEMKQ